uniref:Short transient receptor potential channel 7-like n=1 Tax=Saccoglossus kowalevskii TaxID=10224 RepID=A0ABM0MU17_SACKO|nr:PREDICTED: short transient receptor potential channel 7-like [Saccoglossus kowalevskii]
MAHDPTVELTAADKTLIVWLLIFACAFLMAGLSQLYRLGPRDYFSDVRNWMDLSIFVPFLVDNTLHITDNFVHVNVMVRIFFDSIAAISLVLACLRFIRFFYLSTFLGPLLLLVVAMNGDVIRFLCICFFTVVSFAFGFYYLYAELDGTGDFNAFFTAISALLNTLFTSDPTSSLYVNVIYNVTDSDGDSYDVHDASIMIAGIGVVMYLFFGVSLIIILVNVCIAMMSDTYARLRENIDIEWKYVRTKMWLEHFDGPVLPPFFNVIPSVTWLMYIARKLCYRQNSTGCLAPRTEDNTLGKDILSLSYTKLTKELINRYMIEKGVVSEEDQMFETNGNVNAIEKNNLGLGGPGVVIHVGPNDEAHQKRDSVN